MFPFVVAALGLAFFGFVFSYHRMVILLIKDVGYFWAIAAAACHLVIWYGISTLIDKRQNPLNR